MAKEGEQIEEATETPKDSTLVSPLATALQSREEPPVQYDVFVCYSRLNEDFADKIANAFTSSGLRAAMYWVDSNNESSGEEAGLRALRNSRVVVPVVSSPSMRNQNVQDKINRALEMSLPILPVQFGSLKPGTSYPFLPEPEQWIDVTIDQSQSKMDEILSATRQVLNRNSASSTILEQAPVVVSALPAIAATKVQLIRDLGVQRALDKMHESVKTGDWSGLFVAIREGDTNIDAVDSNGLTALHFLCALCTTPAEVALLRSWLDLNPNLNAVNFKSAYGFPRGSTPLHIAAERDNMKAARLLLLNGAAPDIENKERLTAREIASGDTEMFLELFESPSPTKANSALRSSLDRRPHKADNIFNAVYAGADDLTMQDAIGRTALHWAAQESEVEVCDLLLHRGANLYALDNAGRTPVNLARKRNSIEVEEKLLEWEKSHSNVDKPPASGTAEKPITPPLASEAPSITKANEDLEAALALKGGHKAKRIFQAIRDGATDFAAADQTGRTSLHWAVSKGDLEIVKLIVKGGGEVDARTKDEETSLHYAAKNDFANIAMELLDYGASIEAEQKYYQTPLGVTASCGAVSVARVLIDRGADIKASDALESTPLHNAMEKDSVEVAKLLIHHGADIEARNEEEETPLHVAAYFNALQCTQMLLSLGANHSARNKNQETPISIASNFDSEEIMQMLKQAGAT